MKISDPHKFSNRVLYPVATVSFVLSVTTAMFTSIVVGGQPITLIVSMVSLFIGALTLEKASDLKNRRNQ